MASYGLFTNFLGGEYHGSCGFFIWWDLVIHSE